jgi:radical SAM protein with 4Fe4S-binding SPASM domain
MDWGLYRKIIDQFKEFPEKVKTLRLYKDGEPLLNPRFPDMVRYAKDSGYFERIDTTTNGRLLTFKTSRLLALSGLDKIFISVPRDYDQEYINQITYLRVESDIEIFVKIAGDFLTPKEIDRFKWTFSCLSDSCTIEHTAPCWPGFEVEGINKEIGIYGQPITPDILVCPYVFYTLTINSNGTVDHCFVDWKNDFLLGDLRKGDTVKEIWNGDKLKSIQWIMLMGKRKYLNNCGVCEHHMYGQPDNIDQYAEQLLKKMEG